MPETRTVKGFSEVLLPFAEGDFESVPLYIILIKPEKKLNLTTRLFFGIVSFVLNPSVQKRAHAIPHIRIRIKAFITVMTRNIGGICEFRPLENPC